MAKVKEIWKDISYAESYQVSNFGNVRTVGRKINSSVQKCGYRLSKPRVLSINDQGNGYKILCTQIHGKKKNYYIHRLVAEFFVPNHDNLPEVNHFDSDRSNNHYTNLEWVTRSENMMHASKHGFLKNGAENHNAKLTESQVIEILTKARENPNINRKELAKIYGVSDTAICKIISGKRWKRIFKKFTDHPLDAMKRNLSFSRLAKDETV